MNRAEHAYLLSMDTSLSWNEVAERAGYSSRGSAQSAVVRFCRNLGAAPPPRRRAGPSAIAGEASYAMRVSGMKWREIARAHGKRICTVYQSAQRYARRAGKPWPIGGAA